MNEDIKIYDITLEDYDAGVYAISLVDKPAIESNFKYFKKEETTPLFQFSDEEKGEVIGAILVPDKLILRNINGINFYVRFSKDVIAQINERMSITGGSNVFTIQHEMDARNTVTLLENWIKETEEDKSSALGINEPIGSLFIKAKIHSQLVKDNIKDGKLNGFSVELDSSIIETALNEHNNNNKIMDFKSMYENSVSVNDIELLFNGEKIEKSSLLFHVVGEEEARKLLPFDGQFKIDNVEYTAKDGLVTEVVDINLSIEEKVDAAIKAVNELKSIVEANKEDEGETIAEKLDTILTKMAEDKLSKAQDNEPDVTNDVNDAVNFSQENYDNVREWSKRWNEIVK